ncbi:hypothetical protein HAX54_051389 [Datura stramonium]|uniref:Uncharacterized protein n=1 Tax=Datura stramonium TaxID=4076 RepID=A0ABS8SXL9_DATST|nr:hypothetical protein [Datura stramonium]
MPTRWARPAVCLPSRGEDGRLAPGLAPNLRARRTAYSAGLLLPRVACAILVRLVASSFDLCIVHSNFFTYDHSSEKEGEEEGSRSRLRSPMMVILVVVRSFSWKKKWINLDPWDVV